jgi:hypothetical protein
MLKEIYDFSGFCHNCEFLNPKEAEQGMMNKVKKFDDHTCTRFNRRVMHFGYHPLILRLPECIEEQKTGVEEALKLSETLYGGKKNG